MKKVLSCFVSSLLFVLSISANAGPGTQVNGIAVNNPADGMKIVEAFNDWMDGPGKKSQNRILLLSHVADGMNPATHSFVTIFPSVASSESFSKSVVENEKHMAEWMSFLSKVVPLSRITSTTRNTHIRAWGNVNNEDKVWISHGLSSNDGRGVYRAVNEWMSSDTGKKFPGQLHMFATVAGSPSSHSIVIGYKSQAEMEEWGEQSNGSVALANLLHSLQQVSEYHGANITSEVAAWGEDLEDVLKR